MEKALKVIGILTSSAVVALVVAYIPARVKTKGVCKTTDGHVEYNVVLDGRGVRAANNVRIAFDFWDTAHGKLDRVLQFDPSTDHSLASDESNDRFVIRLNDPLTFFQHLTIHVADIAATGAQPPEHPKVVVSAEHIREQLVKWECKE